MFKTFCKKVAATLVGFCTGFILGPFVGAGKVISIIHEELMRPEDETSGPHDKSPLGVLSMFVLGVPLFFSCGFIYGPIKGIALGLKEGLHPNIIPNIAREMFTYDPMSLTAAEAAEVPHAEGILLSYRTFRATNLLSDTKISSAKTKLIHLTTSTSSQSSSATLGGEKKKTLQINDNEGSFSRRVTF